MGCLVILLNRHFKKRVFVTIKCSKVVRIQRMRDGQQDMIEYWLPAKLHTFRVRQ